MISLKKILYLTIAIALLGGCQNSWQRALDRADKSLLHGNDLRGWRLIQEINSTSVTYYTVQKIDADTLKVLFFNLAKDDKVRVSGFRKQYRLPNSDSAFLEMKSQDTLFFYSLENGKKVFYVGEYAYRFAHFEMDSVETNFYLRHEDSLRKVKGNGLPKLPPQR